MVSLSCRLTASTAPGPDLDYKLTTLASNLISVPVLTPNPLLGDPEVAKDNEVLESIMTIVSDRAAVSKPEGAGGGTASEAAASFLSGLGRGGDEHASGRSSRDRDRDRDRCDSPHWPDGHSEVYHSLRVTSQDSPSLRIHMCLSTLQAVQRSRLHPAAAVPCVISCSACCTNRTRLANDILKLMCCRHCVSCHTSAFEELGISKR